MAEAIGLSTGKNWVGPESGKQQLDTLVLLPLVVLSLDLDMEPYYSKGELEPDLEQGKRELGLEKILSNMMAGASTGAFTGYGSNAGISS